MRPIGDRQTTTFNKLAAPLPVAAAQPAPLPAPARKLASLAADALGVATKAQGFEATPPVDLQSVVLPGDYANNSTQSGTSGTNGTSRPGPRRADAGPGLPEGQDFANNSTQAGTSGSPKPPTRPGPRRADAGMSIQEIGEA
jgi:hypothetical protein